MVKENLATMLNDAELRLVMLKLDLEGGKYVGAEQVEKVRRDIERVKQYANNGPMKRFGEEDVKHYIQSAQAFVDEYKNINVGNK